MNETRERSRSGSKAGPDGLDMEIHAVDGVISGPVDKS
jgi:dynein heavy chain, axonemal